MLDQHEELARLLLEDPEAARSDMGVRLFNELQLLRDLNERRELEKAKHALEVELAHVRRVALMGELTASLAHEVLQSLAAVNANADAGPRWLAGGPPNLASQADRPQRQTSARSDHARPRVGEEVASDQGVAGPNGKYSRSTCRYQHRGGAPPGFRENRISSGLAIGAG